MQRSQVLGIDAGSTHAVAVLSEGGPDGPRVRGVGMVPAAGVRRGIVVDLEAASRSIREAVRQALEAAGAEGVERAVVSVSGAHLRSLTGRAAVSVHRPVTGVSPEDVRRALDQASVVELPEGREVIHNLPRSYSLDGGDGISEPLGLAGRSLEATAHLITGKALQVQNALRAATGAGLVILDYLVGVRAAGQAVLTAEERESGVLLLDIGGGTTSVAVYERGHLWHVAVIPVGGDLITSDLATLLHIPVAVAESIKVERGWASVELCPDARFELISPSGQRVRELEDQRVAAIIESRVHEILGMAAEQVQRSGYTGLFPAGLVLTGGGSRLQGLLEVAADGLGLPARLGASGDPSASEPELSTAVGLAQWGARLAEEEAQARAQVASTSGWSRLREWLTGVWR